MIRTRYMRPLVVFFAMLAAVFVLVSEADARAGGGASSGSRGGRSFSAPPATTTAPTTARPLERTMAQPGQVGQPGRVSSPGLFGGLFNRPGLMGGLFAGLLGAGLFGLLFGHGLFGGLGGIASIFGLLLQIALVVLVARLIWGWWQRRNAPAYAGAPMLRDASQGPGAPGPYSSGGGSGAGFAGSAITIGQEDFETFERLLGEIQASYGAEDLGALRQRATPEMVSYFADDLAKNASRGVVNRVSDVKLLQGDLAEAWREGDAEYATVAMRYGLKDTYVDRASGRVVEGDANQPTEATELWTFRRDRGGHWLLSAIQQT
jgi:predicted lipid-binding transport protein (Tim44 family)